MSASMSRLHITPLTPDLLNAVLGSRLTAYAKTVSYHHIQTEPQKDFGFIELPTMEAEKVKKKLNGAILQGKKLTVEDARPMKRTFANTEEESAEAQPSSSSRSKRAKLDVNVLAAQELSPDRKVKRGWTEPKTIKSSKKNKDGLDKKSKPQAPSKYSENAELLFRTKVPANKQSEEVKEKRRRSKKAGSNDVVHEFEKNNMVPSFLRNDESGKSSQAVEYRDGEGWVDEDGIVVEQESSRASRKRKAANMSLEIDVDKAQALHTRKPTQIPPSPPSSQRNSHLDSSSNNAGTQAEDETSSSGPSESSSDSSSDSEGHSAEAEAEAEEKSVDEQVTVESHQDATGTSEKNSSEAIHPLEAIFKKPKIPTADKGPLSSNTLSSTASPSTGKSKPSLELSTSFAFFGPSDDDDDDDEEDHEQVHTLRTPHTNDISHLLPPMPMTPFSSQDFRVRRVRSAAPTPDTADIRKSTGYGSLILGEDDPNEVLSDGEDNDDQASGENGRKGSISGNSLQTLQGLPQSEFEKRFWEQRGENNRAWKARRRAVLKEQRQRDNRARRPRNI